MYSIVAQRALRARIIINSRSVLLIDVERMM